MAEITRKDGHSFESASMTRYEFTSLQSFTTDRDAHMEKAVRLAREVFTQVVAVDEDETADPIELYTSKTGEDGSRDEWHRGYLCIENLKGLKSEILDAFKVQVQIWELEDQLWLRNADGADRYRADWHFADPWARKLLVAAHTQLGLNDHERTDRTTDYSESMITQDDQDPKAEKLYWGLARQSVKLLRECLAQFIQQYDRHAKVDQAPTTE